MGVTHSESSNWRSSGKLAGELEKFTGNLHLGTLAFDLGRERFPRLRAEGEAGSVGVLGVADRDGTARGRDFDAVTPVA